MFQVTDKHVDDRCRTPGRQNGSANTPAGAGLRSHWINLQPLTDKLDLRDCQVQVEIIVNGIIADHTAGLVGYITCNDLLNQWPTTFTSAQLVASTDPVGLVLRRVRGAQLLLPRQHGVRDPAGQRGRPGQDQLHRLAADERPLNAASVHDEGERPT